MDRQVVGMSVSERGRSVSLQEDNRVGGGVVDKDDRRQTHSAMERKYRQELNTHIGELKAVVPSCSSSSGRSKGGAVNKVTVLKKTTEYITFMHHQERINGLAQRLHHLNSLPIGATTPQQLTQLKEQQTLIEEQYAVIEYLKREIVAHKIEYPEDEQEHTPQVGHLLFHPSTHSFTLPFHSAFHLSWSEIHSLWLTFFIFRFFLNFWHSAIGHAFRRVGPPASSADTARGSVCDTRGCSPRTKGR